jgi:tetratricopeptide (TPR) repeat protein
MKSCFLILLALLTMQRWSAQVSGKILDTEGKPMAGVEIIYKNVGLVTDGQSELPKIIDGNGRIYKMKTDDAGTFLFVGMDYGIYQIEIKDAEGKTFYTSKTRVGDNTDPNVSNVLQVDLSKAEAKMVEPGAETNLSAKKLTKEQAQLVRQEKANAPMINRLIVQFHGATDSQDWPQAIELLQQLIALDSNRWEFYQNLGALQSNEEHCQDAVQSFAKGVNVAEKLLTTADNPVETRKNIGEMLLAEGDCYGRMDKPDEAVAWFEKAAAASPYPALADYRACNTLTNNGKTEAAIVKCKLAIAEDATQWDYYQVLGGALLAANHSSDALDTYEKGIEVAQKTLEETPDSARTKTGLGQMLNSEGNLLVSLRRLEEAVDIFAEAAEVAAYPAMPYFNLCATYYNLKREDAALAACERATASDPTLSDAYYIRGAILFGQGKKEHGKYAVPTGTTESLNKYLEYAPTGQHADAVRNMINKLSEELPDAAAATKK